MAEILALIPSGGAWTVIAVLVVLVFGSQQVLSEEGAKRFWLLGRLAERIQERKLRAIERETRVEHTRADYLESLITDLRRDMDTERERARRAERELRLDLEEAWAYVTWTTSWAREVAQMAAQHGWKPPLPAWQSPEEWRRNRRPPS